MKQERIDIEARHSAARQGFIDASWVAPMTRPSPAPVRSAERMAAHSDSLQHTDGGRHVDAHGDHGDR